MYFLWAYGALQRRKRLMVSGERRGIEIEEATVMKHETEDGAINSAFIPVPTGKHLFIFEWDDRQNVKHVVQL